MKRKLVPLIALLAAALLLTALFVSRAVAQGEGFSETFDDPQLPGWEHSPEVVVSGGVLRIGPGNFAARMGTWQDLELVLKLRCTGAGETHVNYRATDNGGYLLVLTDEEVILRRTARQAAPQELARAALAGVDLAEWTGLQIVLQGGEHSISVDGQLVLTASDPTPLPRGGLVFASPGGLTTELDDITLRVPAGSPPLGPGRQEPVPTAVPPTPTPAPSSWQTVLSQLAASQGAPFEAGTYAVNLLLAVVTSFILSRVYVHWGASLSNRRKFAANFMLVTVTTTFIILVVRSSVALSLGLVGALSIIRFRAAIKEPEELAYLFFAISLGIGLGDNQRLVTVVALLVVIALIGLARLLRQTQADTNLHLAVSSRAPEKVGMAQVTAVLAQHCPKLRLLRYDENAEVLEMSFVVEFRHLTDLERARAALQALAPSMAISFLDNKGVW
jgi:hypothetical protein